MGRRLLLSLLLGSLLLAAPAAAADGTVERFQLTSGGLTYPYLVYTPSTYRADGTRPLLVMVHGCQTTADQQMRANLYNAIAEREGFAVLYPDTDATADMQPGPLAKCWRFFAPVTWSRGAGDTAAIAAMTRAVVASKRSDPERVYMMGMSAGAFMTTILSATYPDLYAAAGVMAGGPYATGVLCALQPFTADALPPALLASLAFGQMGPRARVLPTIELHGDKDAAIPPACGENVVETALRVANLASSGGQDAPIALRPAAVEKGQRPGGRAYTVETFRDPDGCVISEHWIVHGMDHFWSGGSDDPALKNFTDPTGPSAAEASWRFFSRYRKSQTGLPCAEADPIGQPAPVAPKPNHCGSRALRIRVAVRRGERLRRATVTVNGRRRTALVRGKVVEVTLPRPRQGRLRVVVRARTQHGRAIVVKRLFRSCR